MSPAYKETWRTLAISIVSSRKSNGRKASSILCSPMPVARSTPLGEISLEVTLGGFRAMRFRFQANNASDAVRVRLISKGCRFAPERAAF